MRVKESDRIDTTVMLLNHLGVLQGDTIVDLLGLAVGEAGLFVQGHQPLGHGLDGAQVQLQRDRVFRVRRLVGADADGPPPRQPRHRAARRPA